MVSRLPALCTAQRRLFHGSAVSLMQRLNGIPSVVEDNTEAESEFVQGEILDMAVNLRQSRPGDVIQIPYELTITESMQDFWHSAFHSQDRIHTSRPFARKMGLQDKVLPFPLALFLTSSMSHADAAKVQVGFGAVQYLWPAFAGDTFTKTFQVKSVRNTSDGNHSIIQFTCDLLNQRGRTCMRADKRLLFEFPVTESSVVAPPNPETQLFRNHLLSKATVLGESHSLAPLKEGQLILHTMHRSLSQSQSQQLASLARLTHERHFDTRKFEKEELLIPGGLVLGLVMSAASRDLHEILHEEILHASYANSLHPENCVGAISYIQSVDDSVPGDLEIINVRTVGLKNVNVKRDLKDVELPLELFTGDVMLPKELERVCKTLCPILTNKIVVIMDRRIIRQSSSHEGVFLL